jgi:hypothetical protein
MDKKRRVRVMASQAYHLLVHKAPAERSIKDIMQKATQARKLTDEDVKKIVTKARDER